MNSIFRNTMSYTFKQILDNNNADDVMREVIKCIRKKTKPILTDNRRALSSLVHELKESYGVDYNYCITNILEDQYRFRTTDNMIFVNLGETQEINFNMTLKNKQDQNETVRLPHGWAIIIKPSIFNSWTIDLSCGNESQFMLMIFNSITQKKEISKVRQLKIWGTRQLKKILK